MLNGLLNRLSVAIAGFSLCISLQVGRSVIALAQLSILILTSWANLTPEIVGQERAPSCLGVAHASIFCLDPSDDKLVARLSAGLALALVLSGFVPAVSGILHAWVSFSLSTSIGLPDGGDSAAAVATILIAFMTLSDRRWNAWRKGPSGTSLTVLDGIAWGAWWMLRLQMAFIYIESGLSKFGTEQWVNGSALYYVVRDPSFGSSGIAGDMARAIAGVPLGTASLTWGTIALEVAVGVLLLGRPRSRRITLVLVVALHVGIIIFIGLWSFAVTMMGAVLVAAAPSVRRSRHPRRLLSWPRNRTRKVCLSS